MTVFMWCPFLVQTERSVDMLLHGKKPLVEVIFISMFLAVLGWDTLHGMAEK
jgi:hypothetical protein